MGRNMKPKEYIERNLKGFEADSFIKSEIEKLRDRFRIKTAIETGTYLGGTTKVLSTMFDEVYTCELDEENFKKANDYLRDIDNVILVKQSSPKFLDDLLQILTASSNIKLFFLDAHWSNDCPLLDELSCIAKHKLKPVIVIHDWKVPDRPDLGFDSYNGQDFTFEWIESHLELIYGRDGFKYHYNDQAEGAKRGVIYIYPA